MSKHYFEEIFEYPIAEFTIHLEKVNNERIVFSGKYGSGKTTFLKDFFKTEHQQKIFNEDKYEAFHLFPVNYSIANNEDIIKYIKHDLIIELLNKRISPEQIKLDILDTLPSFVQKELQKIGKTIVSMVPEIGKSIIEIHEKLSELIADFQKLHYKANEMDGDKMIEYLSSIESKEGSIYESDVLTKIIAGTIKINGKQPILIIDDLDRIDPEHIFRILNVFAAHFDTELKSGMKNKFGFEKVLLVCDFNNIKRIFHYKYGEEVDFMGYADKFYSSDIYQFDNKKAVFDVIQKLLEGITYSDKADEDKELQRINLGNGFLQEIIQLMLNNNIVSLRNLMKLEGQRINYWAQEILLGKNNKRSSWKLPMTFQLKLLRNLIGDVDSLHQFIDKSLNSDDILSNYEIYAANLLHILSGEDHSWRSDSYVCKFDNCNIYVEFRVNMQTEIVEHVALYNIQYGDKKQPLKGDSFPIPTNFIWKVMKATVTKLNKLGYIS